MTLEGTSAAGRWGTRGLVVALCLATMSPAATAQSAPGIVVTDTPVAGVQVRRATVATVIQAPLEAVSRQVMDFERYPEFIPRFREARVMRRRRAVTDVYVQLELPRALGVVWFTQQVTVVRPSRDRLELHGVAVDGNAGRVETLAVLERLPGPRPATRFSFSLLGVPLLPVPSGLVNDQLRSAVATVAGSLRARVTTPPPPPGRTASR